MNIRLTGHPRTARILGVGEALLIFDAIHVWLRYECHNLGAAPEDSE
jgi:hypothetical protein